MLQNFFFGSPVLSDCHLYFYCVRKPLLVLWNVSYTRIITARKRCLRRLFLHVSVILSTGWRGGGVLSQYALQVVSQHALQQVSRGISRPTAKKEVEGDLVQVHSQGWSWGGSVWGVWGVLRGGDACSGGCLLQGVPALGGCLLRGVPAPEESALRGCAWG